MIVVGISKKCVGKESNKLMQYEVIKAIKNVFCDGKININQKNISNLF